MRRALSTKIPKAIDPQFEQVFVQYGHRVTEQTYGKRYTTRAIAALGKLALIRKRRAFVRGDVAVNIEGGSR